MSQLRSPKRWSRTTSSKSSRSGRRASRPRYARASTEGEAKAETELKAVNAELADLNNKYGQFIMSSEELLTIDTQKAEAPLRFATSENTFVVEGWVPREDFDRFKSTLEKATDE